MEVSRGTWIYLFKHVKGHLWVSPLAPLYYGPFCSALHMTGGWNQGLYASELRLSTTMQGTSYFITWKYLWSLLTLHQPISQMRIPLKLQDITYRIRGLSPNCNHNWGGVSAVGRTFTLHNHRSTITNSLVWHHHRHVSPCEWWHVAPIRPLKTPKISDTCPPATLTSILPHHSWH